MSTEPLGGDVRGADKDDLAVLAGDADETKKGKEAPALEGDEEEEENEEPEETTEEEPGDVTPEEVEEEKAGEEKEEKEEKPEDEKGADTRLVKAVEKKYPGFFKEFPDLRRAYFRDMQTSRIAATPSELEELAAKAGVMDEFQQEIMSGSSKRLLDVTAETDPAAMEKFALNFLPTVEEKDRALAGRMIVPYVKRIMRNALTDAKDAGNANLANSIAHLSKYLFKSTSVPDDVVERDQKDNPEVVKLRADAEAKSRRIAGSFFSRVHTGAEGILTAEISKSLAADSRFSPIERRAIAKQIFDKIGVELDRDQRHTKLMDSHWDKIKKADFPEHMITQVVNAFLGGARNRLQPVRARVIAAALKEKGIVVEPSGSVPATPRTGGTSRGGTGVVKSDQVDYRNSSDEDIMAGKAKIKKG